MIPRKPMATPAVAVQMLNPRLMLAGELQLKMADQVGYVQVTHRYPAGARQLSGASCLLTLEQAIELHSGLSRLLEAQL